MDFFTTNRRCQLHCFPVIAGTFAKYSKQVYTQVLSCCVGLQQGDTKYIFLQVFVFLLLKTRLVVRVNSPKAVISPRIVFFPIGPIWARLSPINLFFDRSDCRPESPRITVVPWSSWSSEDLVRVGCLHPVDTTHDPRQRATEAIRKLQRAGETRGPSGNPRTINETTGRRFLIGYCFSTCFKTVANRFFGRSSQEGIGLAGSRLISQKCGRSTKKGSGTVGTKQSLLKWPL